jgi:co-chaperonin GroES (HSP10)
MTQLKAMPGKVILDDKYRDVSPDRMTKSGLIYIPIEAENDSVATVHAVGDGVHPDIKVGEDVFFQIDTQRCESFQCDGKWFVCIPQDDVIGAVDGYFQGCFD